MTINEALEILVNAKYCRNDVHEKRVNEAVEVLRESANKVLPKKPIDIADTFGDCTLCCPNCKKPIVNTLYPKRYAPDYCQYCGQALDWSEDEDS